MRATEACDLLNISISTLKRWAKAGKIRASLDHNGRSMYWEDDVYKMAGRKLLRSNWSVLYVRVPSSRADHCIQMKEQLEILTEFAMKSGHAVDKVYADYCPSTEWNYTRRPAVYELIKDIHDKKVLTVFIESKDRLAAVGAEILPFVLSQYKVEVIIMNKGVPRKIHSDELAEDLTHLLTDVAATIKGNKVITSNKIKIPRKKLSQTEVNDIPATWKDESVVGRLKEEPKVRNDLSDLL